MALLRILDYEKNTAPARDWPLGWSWSAVRTHPSVLNSLVLNEVAGIGIALVPLYFFDTKVFLPALAATILVLVSHIIRVKGHIREWANPKSGIPSG
jgi:hypothetical protein